MLEAAGPETLKSGYRWVNMGINSEQTVEQSQLERSA